MGIFILKEKNLHGKEARRKEFKGKEADFGPVTLASSRITQIPCNIKNSERLGEKYKNGNQ